MSIDLEKVTKKYGNRIVLDNISLSVAHGELVVLLGPSGSGKSTLLSSIAGFIKPDSGAIRFNGNDVSGTPPNQRAIGMVFQDQSLWPHMTVEEHLLFVLRAQKIEKNEAKKKAGELLEILELSKFAKQFPSSLSGGEAQRVALGRALIKKPDILLLDEPLGQLDRVLREKMLQLIASLHKKFGTTTLFVTHDYEEAFKLADRIAVIINGQVVQVASPYEVYNHPGSGRVAQLTGEVDLLDGEVCAPRKVKTFLGVMETSNELSGKQIKVCLRPADVEVEETCDGNALIIGSSLSGGHWQLSVRIDSHIVKVLTEKYYPTGVKVNCKPNKPVWVING
ncbi:MAG: ABC transporter ATP-binding protein [Planctomycetes bacterium]|nr:ABC transporter ATP-binding protein [Planctomycetota bacterium]